MSWNREQELEDTPQNHYSYKREAAILLSSKQVVVDRAHHVENNGRLGCVKNAMPQSERKCVCTADY
jgi:hypothetical protein